MSKLTAFYRISSGYPPYDGIQSTSLISLSTSLRIEVPPRPQPPNNHHLDAHPTGGIYAPKRVIVIVGSGTRIGGWTRTQPPPRQPPKSENKLERAMGIEPT